MARGFIRNRRNKEETYQQLRATFGQTFGEVGSPAASWVSQSDELFCVSADERSPVGGVAPCNHFERP
jgi:hypothetical protein